MRLVVIGDGEERERLEQHAAALFPTLPTEGPNRPIRFIGWVSQSACASELAEVDCLVMPSLRECGGAVILEAMAMSKPVIATAWGGALDYLDRSCGILVEPTSRIALVEGIAAAMVRLARSPGERVAMGQRGTAQGRVRLRLGREGRRHPAGLSTRARRSDRVRIRRRDRDLTAFVQTISNRLRSAFARRFLVALRRATHRLPVQLEAVRRSRILVLAPHFDDEAIACGGTLLLHKEAASQVCVVFVSDSSGALVDPVEAAQVKATRRREMQQVQAALSLASVIELDFPDGSLVRHEGAIAARLAGTLKDFRPQQVLCPFPVDAHADHQATALAFASATELSGWQGEVLAYEVWSTLWPNMAIDIGSVAEAKARLIRLYASQMGDRDYAQAILGLNRYRGLQHRVQLAEAFHRCDPAQFRRLAACLDSFG